jgi:type I restriction enzyme S subunit
MMTEVRLKTVTQQLVRKGFGGTRPTVNLEHVMAGAGKLDVEPLAITDAHDNLAFEPGDVLFSKLRPYLAKSLLVDRPMFGSPEFLAIHPEPDLDSRFLLYLTLSSGWLAWAEATSYGTKMPRTSWQDMSQFRLRLPPIEEQWRIADFLDDQVALLDRAIDLRARQQTLLQARQWANLLADVEAAHPQQVAIRRLLTFLTDGPFGSAFTSSDYVAEGAFVVRLGNIGFAEFHAGDGVFIAEDMWLRFPRCHVRRGDLLIAGLGDTNNHPGRACVAPELGLALVKGKCFCARVEDKMVSADYLALILSSPLGADLLALETRGSTRGMINLEIVKSLVVPLPERIAQERIVRDAILLRSEMANACALIEGQSFRLAERKQALITAAVTGQFDVTTARSVA